MTEASTLHRSKNFADAIAIYREILRDHPEQIDALGLLASALRSTGRLQEALSVYADAARLDGHHAEFWINYGNALNEASRGSEARKAFEHALAANPAHATAYTNLAIALAKDGEQRRAVELYRRALEIDPLNKIARHNLGNLLADLGEFHEAVAQLREVTYRWPELAEGHYNLGLVLLRLGDFAQGLPEYEWRWETAGFFEKPAYRNIPVWAGEPLHGRRLIVHAEQGLGDMIQFARVLGLLSSLGGEIIFHVPQKIERLMKSLPFPIHVTGAHSASGGDFQIPLVSVLHRLQLTPGSLPKLAHHLSAEPEREAHWRKKLRLDSQERKIGLVWQGNPNSPAEQGRSLDSATRWAPFAGLKDCRLIALQMLDRDLLEEADTQSGWRVRGLPFILEHPGPDMDRGADAFIDTAAIMAGLDLVVSVCTSPLHLAGALGRPAIGLLKSVPDWRWMVGRESSPWYPSMHLVRQRLEEADFVPAIDRAVKKAFTLLEAG